jgi:hypothetical protein
MSPEPRGLHNSLMYGNVRYDRPGGTGLAPGLKMEPISPAMAVLATPALNMKNLHAGFKNDPPRLLAHAESLSALQSSLLYL